MYAYEYEGKMRKNDNDTDLDALLEQAGDDKQVTDDEYDALCEVYRELMFKKGN